MKQTEIPLCILILFEKNIQIFVVYYFIVESVLKKIYILHTCIIGQLPSVDLRFLKCSKNSRSEDYYSMIFSLVWFGSVNDAKASVFGYLQWRQTEWKLTSATRLFDHEKRDFRDF